MSEFSKAVQIGHEPRIVGAEVQGHRFLCGECSCGWKSENKWAMTMSTARCFAALDCIQHAIETVTAVMPDKFKVSFKGLHS